MNSLTKSQVFDKDASWSPSNLLDPAFDTVSGARLDEFMLRALRQQLQFAQAHVPFWRDRLVNINVDEITSISDIALVPVLTKEDLRKLGPWDLVPEVAKDNLYLCRSTTGTTGTATSAFWTKADWKGLTVATCNHPAPDLQS